MTHFAKASAPGKIHLIGEHSSVYGKPAILCAINKRVVVVLKRTAKDNFFKDDKIAREAVISIRSYIKEKYKVKNIPVWIDVTSTIPVGRGLGSSASLSAAISQAFFSLYRINAGPDEVFNAAYAGEKIFHGNPSGGDLAVCVYGGVIWFRKETENIKLIKKIKVDPSTFKNVLLVDSGKPVESTREMVVDIVGKKEVGKFLIAQEKLTKEVSDSLINNKQKLLRESIVSSGKNLEKLGVVGKQAQKIIFDLSNLGDSAKVSGAGGFKEGSGIILVFCKNISRTKKYCKEPENPLEFMEFKLESKGVIIEK